MNKRHPASAVTPERQLQKRRWVRWSTLIALLSLTFGLNAQGILLNNPSGSTLDQAQLNAYNYITAKPHFLTYEVVDLNLDLLEGNFMEIELPDGRMVQITKTLMERKSSELHYDYIGEVDRAGMGSGFNAVRKGDNLRANLRVDDRLWTIRPLGGGLHLFSEEDLDYLSGIAESSDDVRQDPNPGWSGYYDRDTQSGPVEDDGSDQELIDQDGASSEAAAGSCKMRLLVAYSLETNANPSPELEIELATQIFNNSNANSSVTHRVEIALVEYTGWSEAGFSCSSTIDAMINGSDGVLDNLITLRDLYDADMVQMVSETLCAGLANDIGSVASNAFCVADYDNLTTIYTYAHEFGHLYGCRHNIEADGTLTPYAFGHGYRLVNQWRTVMSYSTGCTSGSACPRIQYWSNPAINYLGNPTGVALISDNESVLDAEASTKAAFQATITNKSVFSSDNISDGEIGDILGNSTLTSNVTYNVFSGGAATFRAGTKITLGPGFRAWNGSEFNAFIDDCTDLLVAEPVDRGPIVSPEEEELLGEILAYPNPFSDQTRVEYTITEKSGVFIDLFNMEGRQIRQLAQFDSLEPGSYQLNIDGSNLASGTYYLRIVMDDKQEMIELAVQH